MVETRTVSANHPDRLTYFHRSSLASEYLGLFPGSADRFDDNQLNATLKVVSQSVSVDINSTVRRFPL